MFQRRFLFWQREHGSFIFGSSDKVPFLSIAVFIIHLQLYQSIERIFLSQKWSVFAVIYLFFRWRVSFIPARHPTQGLVTVTPNFTHNRSFHLGMLQKQDPTIEKQFHTSLPTPYTSKVARSGSANSLRNSIIASRNKEFSLVVHSPVIRTAVFSQHTHHLGLWSRT